MSQIGGPQALAQFSAVTVTAESQAVSSHSERESVTAHTGSVGDLSHMLSAACYRPSIRQSVRRVYHRQEAKLSLG